MTIKTLFSTVSKELVAQSFQGQLPQKLTSSFPGGDFSCSQLQLKDRKKTSEFLRKVHGLVSCSADSLVLASLECQVVHLNRDVFADYLGHENNRVGNVMAKLDYSHAVKSTTLWSEHQRNAWIGHFSAQ